AVCGWRRSASDGSSRLHEAAVRSESLPPAGGPVGRRVPRLGPRPCRVSRVRDAERPPRPFPRRAWERGSAGFRECTSAEPPGAFRLPGPTRRERIPFCLRRPPSPAVRGSAMTSLRAVLCLAIAVLAGASLRAADTPAVLETHARPLFKAYCFDCHGEGEKLRGGLDLRLRRLTVKGGDTGAAVVPGKPQESLLLQRVRDGEMPPGKKKLSPEE